MTDKKAREILNILKEYERAYQYSKDEVVEAIDMANKALEQQRWIPISDRLPEIGQRILVTYNQEDEIKIDITNYSKHGFFISVVIAWMPLPQPYKAESKDEE